MTSNLSLGVGGAKSRAGDEGPPGEPTPDFRALLDVFRGRLEEELDGWLERRIRQTEAIAPEALELTGKLRPYVMRGGKRLRPAILYHAFRGCGGSADEEVMPACLAVELLHTYLLIHDDIMDHAETRRGDPSAHREFATDHRRRGWRGDAAHHGLSAAVLLGDLAHTYAEELFSTCRTAAGAWRRARACFSKMCREVIEGQYLELTAAQRPDLGQQELLQVLRMKSGNYTVQRPAQIGALLAGAPQGTVDGLARFGASIGEAFQLQDDLLGMFGDRDTVGKPVGSDLVEGKFTFLIFHTLRRTEGDDREAVIAALGNPEADADEIDRVCSIIRASGAEGEVARMVEERLEEARRLLEEVGLEPEARAFFRGLGEYLRARKR